MADNHGKNSLANSYLNMKFDYDLLEECLESMKQRISEVAGPVLNEYAKYLYSSCSKITIASNDYEPLIKSLKSLENLNISIPSNSMYEITKAFEKTIDYPSIRQALENNINAIRSILYDLENNTIEDIESKANDIDFSIPFPNDISVAEMEANINGEEYIEPNLDYKKFDILLATMSFIDDPVKATNVLSQLIYFADHSVDMSFKIQIYNALKEQIATLIAGGIIGIALFVIGVLLNYFLKDNEIYKKFIELKNSIRKAKK